MIHEKQIFVLSTSDPATGTWSQLGNPLMLANDVAVSSFGLLSPHVWVIGTVNANNGFRIHKWDNANNFIPDSTNQGRRANRGHPIRDPVDHHQQRWPDAEGLRVIRRTAAGRHSPGSSLVDVGVGEYIDPADGSAALAAFVTNTSGQLWSWSEQTGGGSGEFFIPTKAEFRIAGNNRIAGQTSPSGFGASQIAVGLGPGSGPWAADSASTGRSSDAGEGGRHCHRLRGSNRSRR